MRTYLPTNSIVGIRLDGKAFHTFTKQYDYPYDRRFMDAMNATASAIFSDLIMGSMFAYVQSDEITIFFTDKMGQKSDLMFNGAVQKIISISASLATGAFMRAEPTCKNIPMFDARLFILEDLDEVQEYMDWRRLDARKNAITMAASVFKSHKELMNIPTTERMEFIKGTHLEKLPDDFFNGRILFREKYETVVEFTRHGETVVQDVVRDRVVVKPAIREDVSELVDSFRSRLIREA